MRTLALTVMAFGLCAPLRAQQGDKSMDATKTQAALSLTSPAFKEGGKIPKQHTGDGKDVSPALHWSGAPPKTKAYALIMDDPDAPVGTWVHWVLFDIPGGLKALPEGVAKTETVRGIGVNGAAWGVGSYSRVGYYGPQPPPGSPHRYHFKLYALDKELALKPRATKEEVLKAMEGHVLGQAELIGTYQR